MRGKALDHATYSYLQSCSYVLVARRVYSQVAGWSWNNTKAFQNLMIQKTKSVLRGVTLGLYKVDEFNCTLYVSKDKNPIIVNIVVVTTTNSSSSIVLSLSLVVVAIVALAFFIINHISGSSCNTKNDGDMFPNLLR